MPDPGTGPTHNPPPPTKDNLRLTAPISRSDDAIPLGNGLMEVNVFPPDDARGFMHQRPLHAASAALVSAAGTAA